MIRVAAVGDVHLGPEDHGRFRPAMLELAERADVLLLAGDLTNHGSAEETRAVTAEFGDLPVPVVAVLGNHDHHCDRPEEVTGALREAGIQVLDGESTVVPVGPRALGIAGVKGFGGGFTDNCGSSFGERVMREFIDHAKDSAARLENALHSLDADYRVALTHYSPVPDTLQGEPREIYPFLGSGLLAEAIDSSRVDLAVHGHAHYGSEHGTTAGGVPVRNVANHVLGAPFKVYRLGVEDEHSTSGEARVEARVGGADHKGR
ncbi:Icc-related predicted phosphoesterase [Saccharopolyspora erythraea NRRL 2338]|uniref:Metallophosphoesterase n=2 Tax=Saccharopolyspora erythraea TaxID=1836 RepID=A4FHV9_SACEN|nr:metallophosphoesterase [Saccharopolyspora erythraea]EQD84292.1 metallophosphoesterase [Saccharopolyspora erythraea D]PFG97320.1 Icc-related predicted phosphoesterase [Saccharopolyspora erythraea NRRL 2338]QRK87507.1 metallophosphoesterase [Saccharopolyspora erythraea]CAM03634.1 metallophosphoesterase [Saccharopolyspora erythraea NRRL 2338]